MDRDKAVSGGPLWIQTDELVRRKEGRGWFQGDQTPCEFKQEAEQGGEIFGSRFQGDQNPCGFKPRVAIATKLEPARGCRGIKPPVDSNKRKCCCFGILLDRLQGDQTP